MIHADLIVWAQRWGVSNAAVSELVLALGSNDHAPPVAVSGPSASEARQQSLIRLEAPKHGFWLSRNNVGAFQDPESGRLIRYGLANESKQQNAAVKSADLIGFRKRVIVGSDVGATIAQFASIECKEQGWTYSGTKREIAQARWRDFVTLNGGVAMFASGPDVFKELSK